MLNTPPVIIFGNPRSGTRMCASILDLHPDLCITDEFQNVGMLGKLAEKQISEFIENRVDPDTIPLRRELIIKNYWLMRSNMSTIEKSLGVKIIGNKTPRAEHHFEKYEKLFSVNKPVYVYCVRNAYDVLKSIKNLKNIQWSKLPFNELFDNYKSSYQMFDHIQSSAPERTHYVNVDEYSVSENTYQYFESIFNHLGLEVNDLLIDKINNLGPRNTLQKVRSITKDSSSIEELTDKELKIISTCPDYQEIESKFVFNGVSG